MMTNQEAVKALKANYPDARYEQLREAVDMAISTLQAQDVLDTNVDDTISRQVVIDEWKNDFKGFVNALNIPRDDYNGIMAYIDELSFAQPDSQWIPASKRLPEDGRYLCTYKNDEGVCVDFGRVIDGVWYVIPIAWMPLPEPFKEVTE